LVGLGLTALSTQFRPYRAFEVKLSLQVQNVHNAWLTISFDTGHKQLSNMAHSGYKPVIGFSATLATFKSAGGGIFRCTRFVLYYQSRYVDDIFRPGGRIVGPYQGYLPSISRDRPTNL